MNKCLKCGVYALLGMVPIFGAISCAGGDPDLGDVTTPTVSVTHSISGRVTDMSGAALSATVSLNGTSSVTTESDGTFLFEDVNAGTHTLTAAANGKISKETSVTISSSSDAENPVWNVALSSEGTATTITVASGGEASVVSETLENNDAAEIETVLAMDAAAIASSSAEVTITLTPLYDEDEVENRSLDTRAPANSVLLIGTTVSCSDASATIQGNLTLTYDIDSDLTGSVSAQKYVNGEWVDLSHTVDNGKVTIPVDAFTSYALFCNATVSTSTSSSETLTFNPSSWNNLYGSSAMTVSSSSYTYNIGSDLSAKSNKIEAYLVEILARTAGIGFTTVTGSYPINVSLPIGTAMSISGKQQKTVLTGTMSGKTVSCNQYGTVSISTTTWNRNHTGGSN